MLRLSRGEAWKWVNRRRREHSHVFGRTNWKKGKGVWVCLELLASRSQIKFLAALMPEEVETLTVNEGEVVGIET